MNMNLNEIIVNVLSVLPKSIFLAENGESIQFEASIETLTYTNEFEVNGKWIKLENPVSTQVLNILTSQEFKVIPSEQNDYRDYSSQDSLLTIYLNDNSVALRYLTNAGISELGAKLIMQTISDLKQQKVFLTYGRKRLYTFEPCLEKDLQKYFPSVKYVTYNSNNTRDNEISIFDTFEETEEYPDATVYTVLAENAKELASLFASDWTCDWTPNQSFEDREENEKIQQENAIRESELIIE